MYIRECEIMGEQMKQLNENPIALLGRLIGGAVVDSVVNQKEIDENVVSAVKTVAKSQVGKAIAKTAVGQIKSKVEQRLAQEQKQQQKQQTKTKKVDLEKKDETPNDENKMKRIETATEIGKSVAKTTVKGIMKHLEK